MTNSTAHAIPLQPTSMVRLALASVTALVLVVVVLISPLTGAG
jgi:uncharacterized membrane protein